MDLGYTELFTNIKEKYLDFPDYEEKLEKAKKDSGEDESVMCVEGKIDGIKCLVGVMDSFFMMGSMGSVCGERITRLIEKATEEKLPLILFTTSGGARMQEGVISLFQMAKTSQALAKYRENGLYIAVLTDPTTGGVSASFASLADITISEPNALIGFAGKRVIERTIKETLPKEFQTAEFLLDKGYIDMISDRKDLKKTLALLLRLHNYR
jgi:acetyl-CoA carboxylase carboxyl transferase subunit beta